MMSGSITDVPEIEVGHSQDLAAGTGCTVVICRKGAVPGAAVHGGAPGTRETDALRPENVIPAAHAVFLAGGSAYGLDCGAGVMRYLEENGVGFDAGGFLVPIVPGAVIFDLGFAQPKVRPDARMGYEACRAASRAEARQGNVGAGCGATIGRLAGNMLGHVKGGLGTASIRVGDLVVGAIVAVNCNGDVTDPATGEVIAGTLAPDGRRIAGALSLMTGMTEGFRDVFSKNTTVGVVATNASLTKAMATRVAMMGQDGYARTINPVHTLGDGDSVFCLGTGSLAADINLVGTLAAAVMAEAVVNGVRAAESHRGVPCSREVLARR
jgi:L-aminopeptidase/D-esterase-like protein